MMKDNASLDGPQVQVCPDSMKCAAVRNELHEAQEQLRQALQVRHIALCPHGDPVEIPCELGKRIDELEREIERVDRINAGLRDTLVQLGVERDLARKQLRELLEPSE